MGESYCKTRLLSPKSEVPRLQNLMPLQIRTTAVIFYANPQSNLYVQRWKLPSYTVVNMFKFNIDTFLWLIIFASFSNQVDCVHQQIVVEVFVEVEEKAHTHLPQSEGKNQSGKVENEVFECFCIVIINFHVVKGTEVGNKIVVYELCFGVSQLFCVDQFEGLSPNVVNCDRLYFLIFIVILETKDPYLSEVNEISRKPRILLFHFQI